MTKLRKGDIVTFKAIVGDIVYYDNGYPEYKIILIDADQVVLKEQVSGNLKTGFLSKCKRV